MAQIFYNRLLFLSRSNLIKDLLLQKKIKKKKIAEISNTSPQLVEKIYKKMLKYNIIDDYYKKFLVDKK